MGRRSPTHRQSGVNVLIFAVVNRVRAASEPLPTPDDLAYDNTFTSM
jgi:hypothetical protein